MTKPLTEKSIFIDMLKIYGENPCLWDPSHQHYTNNTFRERAFKLITEKYKLLDENASVKSVKKKLVFMRASYRRELKKVLQALAAGEEYEPHLWYYKPMSFLGTVLQFSNLHNPFLRLTANKEIAHVDVSQAQSDDEPEIKRIKILHSSDDGSENIDEDIEEADDETEVIIHELETSSSKQKYVTGSATNAPIVFGKALGLQLMELQPIQRYIAEKLISDVIYYGRMEKLNLDTSINM